MLVINIYVNEKATSLHTWLLFDFLFLVWMMKMGAWMFFFCLTGSGSQTHKLRIRLPLKDRAWSNNRSLSGPYPQSSEEKPSSAELTKGPTSVLQPKVSLSAEVNAFSVFGFTVVAGVGTELRTINTLTELPSRG